MRLSQMREYLYDIVKQYFAGANVIWTESKIVNPKAPLITLKLKDITVPVFSIQTFKNEVSSDYYKGKKILEINLYTKGKEITTKGVMAGSENTATDDLLSFVMYLNSEYVAANNVKNNLTIMQMSSIQDLTGLSNDTFFEYRAMTEFEVNYIVETSGYAKQVSFIANASNNTEETGEDETTSFEITASGGGTEELNNMEIGYFEDVVIKEELENE